MPVKLTYDSQHDCLVQEFVGVVDEDLIKQQVKLVVAASKEHNCKRLLNDMRQAELGLSIVEIHEIPKFLENEGVDRSWKRAVVFSKDFRDYHFYENVAFNIGFTVKVFTDRQKSLDWLTKK